MPDMDGFELADRLQRSPDCAGAIVVMLTSGERPGDLGRARDVGVSNYLLKPVRREELKEAIVAALAGRSAFDANAARSRAVRNGGALSPPDSPWRVLVAEDNLVNQRLVERLLEKQGHSVVVVENGREVLEALEKDSFDFVLMDVQMPEMDGFEATAAIRENEKLTLDHIPIIALTAHAMKDDQERCIAAGMDAYLSKPVHAVDLFELLKTYGKRERQALSM
jgi:two-component system, sensor histidine kinase and response regulator